MNTEKRILVIGSLNMDMVIPMKRMPMSGETVMGESITHIPGGKGANQACAAGKLGGNVTMLGCVGNDGFGTELLENLRLAGTDVSHIDRIDGVSTGIAVIYVDAKGNNSIVVVPGTNGRCDTDYLKENDILIQESDYVLFQMEIPQEAVFYGITRARELGKTIILNPAPAPDGIPDEILRKIDYITPNETEAAKLAGIEGISLDDMKEAASRLRQRGVGNVLITLGSQGVMLVNEEGFQIFPARKVEAVDTTAAGDCFNGAFVTGLAEGMSPEEAIMFGNLTSSIAVTRKGAQTSIPERNEVERESVSWRDR